MGCGVGILDEVGKDLGVRLAPERVTPALELLAKLLEVLHDPVVHHGDATVTAHMRVRVGHRGPAVRCPTRVADAARGRIVQVRKLGLEARDLAHAARHVKARGPALAHLERHARRVVASILKPLEPIDENSLGSVCASVANDSAHGFPPCPCARPRSGTGDMSFSHGNKG